MTLRKDPFFTDSLLRWFALCSRDLPWRRTRDPYAIWLSEIILQQTRIAQGTAYWERFMERFPTVDALAAASEDEVLRLWQGLGYYSRARNLHTAARQIVALGGFPATFEGIRALKGVGDYTAAAIASISFDLPYAVVDGNVYRVLSRFYGIATPIGTPAAKKEFTALAQALLPDGHASAFNQAMMDLGAIVCTPLSPRCADCPLQEHCTALREGRIALLPVKKPAAPVQERRFAYIYLRCQGYTAIRRRGPGDIWQGLWEPLTVIPSASSVIPSASSVIPSAAKESFKLLMAGIKHQLTHRTLICDFYLWESSERPPLPEGYIWVPEAELGPKYAKPRLFEHLLELL